jgi:hypothetical protein
VPSTASIQAYVTPFGETAGTLQFAAAPDFQHGNAFFLGNVNSVKSLIKYTLKTGAYVISNPVTNYTYAASTPLAPISVDTTGNVWINDGTLSNSSGYWIIEPSALVGTHWGVQSAFSNLPNGIPNPTGNFTPIFISGSPGYMVGNAAGGLIGNHNVDGLLGTSGFNGFDYNWVSTGGGAHLGASCPGGSKNANSCFFLSYPASAGDTPQQIDIWKITVTLPNPWMQAQWPTANSSWSIAHVGSVSPSAVDAGWTAINLMACLVDNTDGNLILKVTGQAGATNPNYVIKVSSTSASVMWVVAVVNISDATPVLAQFSSVRFGTFCHYGANTLASTGGCYTINTLTGSSTLSAYSSNFLGLGSGNQCFIDGLGAIFLEAGFGYVNTNSPTPLTTTPTSFNGWALLSGIATPQNSFTRTYAQIQPIGGG